MFSSGIEMIANEKVFATFAAIVGLLALVLPWPTAGAEGSGGGERVVIGLAWQVEASATMVVGQRQVGRGKVNWQVPKLANTR